MLVSGLEMIEALGADFEICLCWVFFSWFLSWFFFSGFSGSMRAVYCLFPWPIQLVCLLEMPAALGHLLLGRKVEEGICGLLERRSKKRGGITVGFQLQIWEETGGIGSQE